MSKKLSFSMNITVPHSWPQHRIGCWMFTLIVQMICVSRSCTTEIASYHDPSRVLLSPHLLRASVNISPVYPCEVNLQLTGVSRHQGRHALFLSQSIVTSSKWSSKSPNSKCRFCSWTNLTASMGKSEGASWKEPGVSTGRQVDEDEAEE